MGIVLIVAPLAALITLMARDLGWRLVLVVWAGAALFWTSLIVGISLLLPR